MAFDFIKNLLGDGYEEMSEYKIDTLVRDYISTNPLKFRQQSYIEGTQVYTVTVSIALNNKKIPKYYHLIMKGLEIYLVKLQGYETGDPYLKLPKSWGLKAKTISLYDFEKYDINASIIEYKGIYNEEE